MTAIGDLIYARSLDRSRIDDKFGNVWQYNPRSDAHSKAACWALLFDLLSACELLREHVKSEKIGFGINHQMRDFRLNRAKNLDLVICTRKNGYSNRTLWSLADTYEIPLTPEEKSALGRLPHIRECAVGTTLLAMEAKACMTEHQKAKPRLYDELSSSFQTIHGDTQSAIAVAHVTINTSDFFASPLRNKQPLNGTHPVLVEHNQPAAAKEVLAKIRELPRRSSEDGIGYDAIGIVLLSCINDGSTVSLEKSFSDNSEVDEILQYRSLVQRLANMYTTRFRSL